MQQRKGKGGAGVQIRVSVKPQQWRTLSLLSSLVLCVNSNPSRRILVKKTNSHMEKQSTGYLCSFLTAWLGNGKAFRLSGSTFRARLEINPGIIHVERLNAEEKKPCMFSKPDISSGFTVISLHFEIFSPWTEGFVYPDATFSRDPLGVSKRKKCLSSGVDIFNHRRALIVFSRLRS